MKKPFFDAIIEKHQKKNVILKVLATATSATGETVDIRLLIIEKWFIGKAKQRPAAPHNKKH